jgi:hypothetical protein
LVVSAFSRPDTLILPAFAADAAANVGGIGAVLEVVATGCRQCGLQLLGPVLVGLGEPPNLVGGQAEVTEHRPERLATIDPVEELLPQLGW